jgi:hypothetical protein
MDNKTPFTNSSPASVQVYCTKDYGNFHFLKGNRDLNNAKIKRIIESIETGLEFFKYCPIMVNDGGYVIDGQHRFYVCKKLDLPVYYMIVPKFTLRQVAEMNNNASKWNDQDFLNCYIDIGIEHYKFLKTFVEQYQVNLGIASSLLSNGKVKGGYKDDFRDGLFKVNFEGKATTLIVHALSYKKYCKVYNTRNFLQALEILLESPEYRPDEMFEKLELHNLSIENKSSPKEYLTHLEDLFNYRNQKRRRIY